MRTKRDPLQIALKYRGFSCFRVVAHGYFGRKELVLLDPCKL